MKHVILFFLLLAALAVLSGCNNIEQALGKLGDDLEATYVQEAEPGSGAGIDWSFVPVVRELAVTTFTEGVPDAQVIDTSVASKNGSNERVIVTITYQRGEQTGTYGFDYSLTEDGTYELTRYGDGVDANDL